MAEGLRLDINGGTMKDIFNITEVEALEKLENEYDLQKASLFDRKLRLLCKENPELKPIRKKLRSLIEEYEEREWSDLEKVSDEKVAESDKAEFVIEQERKFIAKRKEMIRKKLKEFDMNQQDLGTLLGHPKNYMSELMNGVSQFTMKDLVVIHRVFGISLKSLIPVYLQSETREKISLNIERLNKPKLKLKKMDLAI